MSEWTPEDYRKNAEIKRAYYLTLTEIVWGSSTPRERKRWMRRDPLVYSILKGLGER